MKILVIGASKGLGRAIVDGLGNAGDTIIGVSRSKPQNIKNKNGTTIDWITTDLSKPLEAVNLIDNNTPNDLDVIIYNIGIWEERAFEEDYSFMNDADQQVADIVTTNITSPILLLKRLIPKLLTSSKPHIILTGSTSGLPQSGRPEVTFGASKFALKGIADSLREGYRHKRLAVTCLQLGYLNTEDSIWVPEEKAAQRGDGTLIPVHDVVKILQMLLSLSDSTYVKELILPAILDDRF